MDIWYYAIYFAVQIVVWLFRIFVQVLVWTVTIVFWLIITIVVGLVWLVRVLVRYRQTPALWISLGSCLGLWLLTVGCALLAQHTHDSALSLASLILVVLAVLSLIALFIVARMVEVKHDDLFQEPQSLSVGRFLQRPWWQREKEEMA